MSVGDVPLKGMSGKMRVLLHHVLHEAREHGDQYVGIAHVQSALLTSVGSAAHALLISLCARNKSIPERLQDYCRGSVILTPAKTARSDARFTVAAKSAIYFACGFAQDEQVEANTAHLWLGILATDRRTKEILQDAGTSYTDFVSIVEHITKTNLE